MGDSFACDGAAQEVPEKEGVAFPRLHPLGDLIVVGRGLLVRTDKHSLLSDARHSMYCEGRPVHKDKGWFDCGIQGHEMALERDRSLANNDL